MRKLICISRKKVILKYKLESCAVLSWINFVSEMERKKGWKQNEKNVDHRKNWIWHHHNHSEGHGWDDWLFWSCDVTYLFETDMSFVFVWGQYIRSTKMLYITSARQNQVKLSNVFVLSTCDLDLQSDWYLFSWMSPNVWFGKLSNKLSCQSNKNRRPLLGYFIFWQKREERRNDGALNFRNEMWKWDWLCLFCPNNWYRVKLVYNEQVGTHQMFVITGIRYNLVFICLVIDIWDWNKSIFEH